jgi:hypothetical protein
LAQPPDQGNVPNLCSVKRKERKKKILKKKKKAEETQGKQTGKQKYAPSARVAPRPEPERSFSSLDSPRKLALSGSLSIARSS